MTQFSIIGSTNKTVGSNLKAFYLNPKQETNITSIDKYSSRTLSLQTNITTNFDEGFKIKDSSCWLKLVELFSAFGSGNQVGNLLIF